MTRMMITLSETEAEALARIAYAELRDPREQMRFILRRELQKRGLLEPKAETDDEAKQRGEIEQ